MPVAAKIEPVPLLGVLPGETSLAPASPELRRNGRSRTQGCAGSITAEYEAQAYTQDSALGKARAAKIFLLKNTFADGDGITRFDEKTSAARLFRESAFALTLKI